MKNVKEFSARFVCFFLERILITEIDLFFIIYYTFPWIQKGNYLLYIDVAYKVRSIFLL